MHDLATLLSQQNPAQSLTCPAGHGSGGPAPNMDPLLYVRCEGILNTTMIARMPINVILNDTLNLYSYGETTPTVDIRLMRIMLLPCRVLLLVGI